MSKQVKDETVKNLEALRGKTSNIQIKESINEKLKYVNKPIRK